MNIVKSLDQYDDNNAFFCDPIKNNVMNDGNFIRIIYSTGNFVLNGVYLLVPLNDVVCEKYYTKYRCGFNVTRHKDIIERVRVIEEELLKKINIGSKAAQYKIFEQLKNGTLKIFTDVGNRAACSFVLKISGIWETQYEYGLTYKFIAVS